MVLTMRLSKEAGFFFRVLKGDGPAGPLLEIPVRRES
jgi:hypothetical protein